MRAGAAALAALALAGCPGPRVARSPLPISLAPAEHHDEPALEGVVHVLRRGETLYRIARAYGIDLADLMETNGIADPRMVPAGTELFVPGAARPVEIPPAPSPAEAASAATTPAAASNPAPTATVTPSPTPNSTTEPLPAVAAARHGEPPLAWPLKGVLYGRYGVRDGRRHDGIDIAAPQGTAVAAAADGTVIYAGEQAGYGAIAIVRHEGGLVTLYAHASRLLVREGDHVRRGEPVARVGETGRTTGPHLHFEVRDGTRPKNPLLFLP